MSTEPDLEHWMIQGSADALLRRKADDWKNRIRTIAARLADTRGSHFHAKPLICDEDIEAAVRSLPQPSPPAVSEPTKEN